MTSTNRTFLTLATCFFMVLLLSGCADNPVDTTTELESPLERFHAQLDKQGIAVLSRADYNALGFTESASKTTTSGCKYDELYDYNKTAYFSYKACYDASQVFQNGVWYDRIVFTTESKFTSGPGPWELALDSYTVREDDDVVLQNEYYYEVQSAVNTLSAELNFVYPAVETFTLKQTNEHQLGYVMRYGDQEITQ